MKLLKRKDDTKIVVGPVRLTYCYIGIPYEDGDSLNYKTGILVPKEETEAVKTIQAAIQAAEEQALSTTWGGKKPKDYTSPLKEEDDHYSLTVRSYPKNGQAPKVEVQDRRGNTIRWVKNNAGTYVLEDDQLLYSGVWVFISFVFFGYNTNGNKGVSARLENVRFERNDAPLGGETANSDFGEAAADDDDDL